MIPRSRLVWNWKKLPLREANKFVTQILNGKFDSGGEIKFRQSRRSCPNCKYKRLLVTRRPTGTPKSCPGNIWCVRCHLMVPANAIFNVKTDKQVRF